MHVDQEIAGAHTFVHYGHTELMHYGHSEFGHVTHPVIRDSEALSAYYV